MHLAILFAGNCFQGSRFFVIFFSYDSHPTETKYMLEYNTFHYFRHEFVNTVTAFNFRERLSLHKFSREV